MPGRRRRLSGTRTSSWSRRSTTSSARSATSTPCSSRSRRRRRGDDLRARSGETGDSTARSTSATLAACRRSSTAIEHTREPTRGSSASTDELTPTLLGMPALLVRARRYSVGSSTGERSEVASNRAELRRARPGERDAPRRAYLSPPSRSVTKLYNFAAIDAGRRRSSGSTAARSRSAGYDERSSTTSASGSGDATRCAACTSCFLRRSSADPTHARPLGCPSTSPGSAERAGALGSRRVGAAVSSRRTARRGGAGDWKAPEVHARRPRHASTRRRSSAEREALRWVEPVGAPGRR